MRKSQDGRNMRKYRLCVAALMAVFAFLFAGCAGRQIPDFTSGAETGTGSGGETGKETGKETEAEAKASGKKLSVLSTFPANQSTLTELMSGVEFVFDDNDISASDLESALSISPDIAGEIKRSPSGERWIFYPTVQNFVPNTRYTVTLDSSLTSRSGAKLPEAYTFSFTTGNEDKGYSFAIDRNNSGSATCFLTSELPTCFVYMDPQLTGNKDQVSVDVTLYRFDSIDRYCDALKRFSDDSSMSLLPEGSRDPSRGEGRTKLSAFTISAVSGESAGYTSYYHSSQYLLPFPDKLEAGQYLAEFSVKTPSGTPDTLTRYELLQSSPLSVYYMKSGDQMVAWLHDSGTTKPVENASVTADGDFKGNAVSDADGLARITDSSDRSKEDKKDKSGRSLTIFRVDSGDNHFADARTGYEYDSEDPAQNKNTGKYFTYLYTDRNLYRNTDTIHFWGVLRPRNSQDAVPSSAEVRLGESWSDETSLAGVKVTPDSDGMFQGEIKIDSLKTGYYDPCLYLDDDLVYSGQSLSVEEFVKPTYSVSTSMDKPVYLLSDPAYRSAVLHVDVTYFDGTPASGFRGKIEADGRGAEISAGGDFVADANGHVEIPVTLGNSESNSCYPVQYSVAIENAEAESENVYETQNITVIPRDVMLEAKYDRNAKEIVVTTNRVNISGITEDTGYPDLKTLRGEALPCDVTAQLYKVTYEKNQTGTAYDYVERKSVPQYSYDQKETLVKTENIRTDNGTSAISDLPDTSDQDSYYYYLLSAKDSAGNAVQRKVYLSYFYMYEGELSSHRYEMVKEDSTDIADGGLQEYEYNPSDNEFDSTQNLKMVLSSNHEKVDFPEGTGMMTAIVQSGIGKTEISSDGKRDIAFSEDLIPNFVIAGAYYDGKHT